MIQRCTHVVVLSAILFITSQPALAQQATEVYIPIGSSPGVSKTNTVVGTISDVDYAARRIEVQSPRGTTHIEVDGATQYYLDRSKSRKRNTRGNIDDCESGRRIEVYVSESGTVRWIKIAVD